MPAPVLTERHPRRLVTLHLAAAVVLGVLADIGLRLGDHTIFLFVAATPWVLIAFSAGRASTPRWSALAGAGTLLAGLAAYYLWLLMGLGVSLGVLTGSGFNGATWVVVGAVVGAVAVPCADGFLQFAYGPVSPIAAAAAFGGAALVLLAWAWRSGARIWALTLGVPLATLILWQVELVILQDAFGRLTWI